MHKLFSIAFALFLLMDSLGNVPLFIALLKDFSPKEKKKIIIRELCIALLVIYAFYFLGSLILDLIQIQQHTLSIAGGLILFFIAIRMVFPPSHSKEEQKSLKEPVIVPLAIPLIAGPAVLAAVMIYSQQKEAP